MFGFGPQPPPGGDGDFGPDGFPDEQPSGGMAFFFGGPDKGGYMPPGMEGPEDGEGPPMDLFNAPGIWTSGGTTSFGGPAGEGMPMPPPGEPMDADDLFMMFAGPEGDFGPDGFPDEQPSGGMAFFFGGPDKGGYMPPGMEGPEDGEGPPMDLFNAPGIWTSGGTTSFGGPAGEGMPMPPPGEPMDADDLFMMFAGPEGDFGPDGFPDDGPAAPGGFRGFFGGAPLLSLIHI